MRSTLCYRLRGYVCKVCFEQTNEFTNTYTETMWQGRSDVHIFSMLIFQLFLFLSRWSNRNRHFVLGVPIKLKTIAITLTFSKRRKFMWKWMGKLGSISWRGKEINHLPFIVKSLALSTSSPFFFSSKSSFAQRAKSFSSYNWRNKAA